MAIGNFIAITNSDGTVDFIGEQGTTWGCTITVSTGTPAVPKVLTTYTAKMQMRRSFSDVLPTESFVCSIPNPTLGEIVISMSATKTSALISSKIRVSELTRSKADGGVYLYDLEIATALDAMVDKVLAGKIYINPEVTK